MLGYDALVLATGSYPFVPPVPGRDLPGCFVYRTLDDLDAIRAAAEAAAQRRGAGRPGWSSAAGCSGSRPPARCGCWACRPHVVELAPRLMPLQVDEGGGGAAAPADRGARRDRAHRRRPSTVDRTGPAAGCSPHWPTASSSTSTSWCSPPVCGRATSWPARPAWRRRARRRRGRRRLPHRATPHIYAIGECACIDGRVYGLVAPGYAMAEVVADRLLGGAAEFPGADTSTKLKLLGVDVASFGDAHAATPGALEVTCQQPGRADVREARRVRRRGDAARWHPGRRRVAYALLRPLVGAAAARRPAGADLARAVARRSARGRCRTDAQVCSCHAVTQARDLRRDRGRGPAPTSPGVKTCTKAGTGCGSCVPLLKTLLAESGVEIEHRAVRALRAHPRRSCSTSCGSPASARSPSWSSGTAPGGAATSASRPWRRSWPAWTTGTSSTASRPPLQDTNDHFLANIQKQRHLLGRAAHPGRRDHARRSCIVIGEVARDFGLYTKITGGQRIDLFGARVEQLPLIWQRLVDAGFESGHAYGKALRTVKSCVGSTWCRYGVQDSVSLAIELELRYRGLRCAAQGQGRGVRLRARVRRGAGQGHRRHRHREGLEPLRRRQRRLPAAARRPAAAPTSTPRRCCARSTGS